MKKITEENGGMFSGMKGILLAAGIFCALIFGARSVRAAAGTTVYRGTDYAKVYSFADYMRYNPSLKAKYGASPSMAIRHFVTTGMKNGLRAKSTFDPASYACGNADVRHRYRNNLKLYYWHYMLYGYREPARKATLTGVTKLKGFETTFRGVNYASVYDYNDYVRLHPGIKKTFGYDDAAALKHFVLWGMPAGWVGKSGSTKAAYARKCSGVIQSNMAQIIGSTNTAKKTDSIILVNGHSLQLWKKGTNGWTKVLSAYCGYGKNGLKEASKRREGDGTTPVGSFPILMAFGKGSNPGTALSWRRITEKSYWSGERATYNTWVESAKRIAGEHLADYYQYKYAMAIGFNRNPTVWKRGSAIFLHCKSTNSWSTGGCVSVYESVMLQLLKKCGKNPYIIIVPYSAKISQY